MKTLTTPQDSPDSIWFVYIIECADNSYYTGVTTDLKRRLHEHNNTVRGAKYTRCRRPVTLVHHEKLESRQSACIREYAIKQLSKTQKKRLFQEAGETSSA